NWRHRSAGWRIRYQRRNGFSFVRSKRRDVDEVGYLRMCSCFRYHDPAIRMPDKNNLTFQTVDGGFCKRDVVGEGFRRVLHHHDVVTLFLKYVVDTRPSRAVYKPAVNKRNRFARLLI